jgi:hypothetical protein
LFVGRYLSHSWLPVSGPERFGTSAAVHHRPSLTLSEVVDKVVADGTLQQELLQSWSQPVDFQFGRILVSELPLGYFQKCMRAFASCPAAAAALRCYAEQVELPPPDDGNGAGDAGGDAGGDAAEPDGDAGALDGLGERLLEMSLQLYCRNRRNDYFMLHGVTACFTLLPLLPLLPAAEAAQAGRRMVAALIATFAAQQANSATKLLLPHPQP